MLDFNKIIRKGKALRHFVNMIIIFTHSAVRYVVPQMTRKQSQRQQNTGLKEALRDVEGVPMVQEFLRGFMGP